MPLVSRAAATRPPGPRGVPLLGMLPAVRRNPTGVFVDAARRYGDVVYFKIGPRRGFLITNPARHPPRPAGQRAQLSQESALREVEDVDRQRPAHERGRLLAAPAAHRTAGLPPPAHRRARRCHGRRRAGYRRRLGRACRAWRPGGHRRGDDAPDAHRRRPRTPRRRPRSVRLAGRSRLDDHQRVHRRELLVARARRPAADARSIAGSRRRAPCSRSAVDHVINERRAHRVPRAPICSRC